MMNKENFWNALAMCKTTADRLDLIDARDAEWQSAIHSLEMSNADAYALILSLESMVARLKNAAEAFQELNVCYRINKKPSEALFSQLSKARDALAESAAVRGEVG